MMLFNLNIENPQKIENCKEYVCYNIFVKVD